jgi:fumarylacetoacetate (FAA) hydrolase family protein
VIRRSGPVGLDRFHHLWQQMLAHHEGYPVAVVRAGGTLVVVGRDRLDTGRHHVGDVRANFNVAVLTDQPACA